MRTIDKLGPDNYARKVGLKLAMPETGDQIKRKDIRSWEEEIIA